MEREVVLKWLKIFSVSFFILSIVELLDLILFSFLINLTLDSVQYNIFSVIFQLRVNYTSVMTAHAMLLWIVLLCVICSFIVLSLSIFNVAKKNTIKNYILAKFILLIGLFLIIGGFIKTNFIVLLGNGYISTGIFNITFQDALFSLSIPPIFGGLMWIYFTVVTSCFLVSGLIFGGIGLKWILLIQEEETTDNNT